MAKKNIQLIVMGLAISFVAIFSGCQNSAPLVSKDIYFPSGKGVKMEAFIPADTFAFIKLNPSDGVQIQKLETLLGYFPKEMLQNLEKSFADGFDKEGGSLSFEKDFAPFFRGNPQILLAVKKAPPIENETSESSLPSKTQGEHDFYEILLVEVKNQSAVDGFFDQIVRNGEYSIGSYQGQAYYLEKNVENPIYFAQYKDVLVQTNNLKLLENGLDNVLHQKNPLQENAVFTRAFQDYRSDYLGFAYFETRAFLDLISQNMDEKDAQQFQTILASNNSNIANVESQSYLLSAEDQGVRIQVNFHARKDFQGDAFAEMSKSLAPLRLAQKVPAQAPVFYTEIFGLQHTLQAALTYAKDEQTQALLSQDMFKILDGATSIVINNDGALLPTFGVYVEANKHEEQAQSLLAMADIAVNGALVQLFENSPELKPFVLQSKEGNLRSIKLDVTGLLAQLASNMPQLSTQEVEFYYGLTDDKVLVFTFQPNFIEVWGKNTVSNSASFQKTQNLLNGYDHNVTYVSPAEIINYVDTLMAFAQQINSAEATDLADYELVKPYILPLKSVMLGSARPTPQRSQMELFIQIGQ